jgi:phosphatidyl-myo-inositol dimannoside synthase
MLALVSDAFGGRGGIAQYNRDFLGAVACSGVVSSITVLPRNAPDRVAPAIRELRQLSARAGRLAYALAALGLAFTRRFDIVFCGHLNMVPLAAPIARVTRAKLIVQAHGVEVWPRPTRFRRMGVEAADLVLCVSRHTRGAVLRWTAIAPERVVVLPNTVRKGFSPGEDPMLRAKLGLTGKRVLLTVGRMDARERYKGHDRVIAVIPRLVLDGQDAVYVIVGEGDYRMEIERLARETGIADRVKFLGAVGQQRLLDVYRMADLFVMPSMGEGFGIVFLEAMASGTPALGLAVAGARDSLADGELGTAVSESDLAHAISRLLAAPKPDSRKLAAAVEARFGRQLFVNRVRAVFERLMQVA